MDKPEQLDLWVRGKSLHRYDPEYPKDNSQGECCPDFSCCRPSNKATREERELFQQLYLSEKHEEYERMLMMFMGKAVGSMEVNIYIAGGKP